MEETTESGNESVLEELAEDANQESSEIEDRASKKEYSNSSTDEKYETDRKKDSKKPASKRVSSERSELERKISDLKGEAKKLGVDESGYVSSYLAKHPIWHNKTKILNSKSEKEEETINGAVALLHYYNEDTGEVELLVEQKPVDFPDKSVVGKFTLFGGHKRKGERSIDTLVRELGEELPEPTASIVIDHLRKNCYYYTTLHFSENGQLGHTDVYAIKIESKADWEIVKLTHTQHDAGNARVLTWRQAFKFNDYFAYNYGSTVKEFIMGKLDKNYLGGVTQIPKNVLLSFPQYIPKNYQIVGSNSLATSPQNGIFPQNSNLKLVSLN